MAGSPSRHNHHHHQALLFLVGLRQARVMAGSIGEPREVELVCSVGKEDLVYSVVEILEPQ